jgi:hypothetical protein
VRITAALCWYDEPLWQLEDCVRGMTTLADRVVAVDGRYRRYDGPTTNSPPEQAAVIMETACEVGLECELYEADEPWAGQVEKRSFLLQKATAGADPTRDWFMAVDADHIWTGPRDLIRLEVSQAPDNIDGFTVPMFTPMNPDRPLDESAAGQWHKDHANRFLSPQRLFRSYPNVQVERYHWWYSATKNGRPIWLWGGDRKRGQASMREMQAPMLVEHRCLFREPLQIERNRDFCEDRIQIVNETGQEDDVLVGAVA